jgi:hypothetical protein
MQYMLSGHEHHSAGQRECNKQQPKVVGGGGRRGGWSSRDLIGKARDEITSDRDDLELAHAFTA